MPSFCIPASSTNTHSTDCFLWLEEPGSGHDPGHPFKTCFGCSHHNLWYGWRKQLVYTFLEFLRPEKGTDLQTWPNIENLKWTRNGQRRHFRRLGFLKIQASGGWNFQKSKLPEALIFELPGFRGPGFHKIQPIGPHDDVISVNCVSELLSLLISEFLNVLVESKSWLVGGGWQKARIWICIR